MNVQLIDANTDEHVWANDYDRDLTDVFAIQSDLAQKIAEALQAKLSPAERSQMTRKPTENGEAYLAFVQAHNLASSIEDFEHSNRVSSFTSAPSNSIQTLPSRLRATRNWKAGSCTTENIHQNGAKKHVLLPSALCSCSLTCRKRIWLSVSLITMAINNYDAALREFEIARRGLPNDSEFISLSARSNAGKANGRSPLQIWRRPSV